MRRFGNRTPSSLSGLASWRGHFWSGDPVARRGSTAGWTGANLAAAGFPGRRVLGFYRTPKQTNWPAIVRRWRAAPGILRNWIGCSRPFVSARDALTLATYRGLAVPVFRTGDRASAAAAGRALVSHALRNAPRFAIRHDPVRGIAGALLDQ